MLTVEKRKIIDEVLFTDVGILSIAKHATANVSDSVQRRIEEAHMIALLKLRRVGSAMKMQSRV